MQSDTVVGFLADALSGAVTEERSGVCKQSLICPVTGGLFPKPQIDRFVKSKPNDIASCCFSVPVTVQAPELPE